MESSSKTFSRRNKRKRPADKLESKRNNQNEDESWLPQIEASPRKNAIKKRKVLQETPVSEDEDEDHGGDEVAEVLLKRANEEGQQTQK